MLSLSKSVYFARENKENFGWIGRDINELSPQTPCSTSYTPPGVRNQGLRVQFVHIR